MKNQILKLEKTQLSTLPKWTKDFIELSKWYVNYQGWDPLEVMSSEKDYIKWDICFNNPQIPMFIAIFEDSGTVYFHLDCAILEISDITNEEKLKLLDYTYRKTWNLLVEFKPAINSKGHLSINILGKLKNITPDYFKYLLSEIVPYSQYIHSEIKKKF